jgi:hypothetical protein
MKTWILLTSLTIVLMVTATPALAQTVAGSAAQPARSDNGRRAEIEQVQQLLKQQGHDPGRIDGSWACRRLPP